MPEKLRRIRRRAGEVELVDDSQRIYVGTLLRRRSGWYAYDDGGRMTEQKFDTLEAAAAWLENDYARGW